MSEQKKISLTDLKDAVAASSNPETAPVPKVRTRKLQRAIGSRLVAHEYLRNGLNLKQAYEDVTKKKYTPSRFNAMLNADNSFLDEVNLALTSSDIEKNQIVGMLWAMASISPLDYMDDQGVTLSVADLKKMPREMQAMLEAVEVINEQVPVKNEDGEIQRDAEGKPYLRTVQKVQVRIVKAKKEALSTLAQIAKLIGPTVLQGNNITVYNVGDAMAKADDRRRNLLESRLGGIIEVKPDGSIET